METAARMKLMRHCVIKNNCTCSNNWIYFEQNHSVLNTLQIRAKKIIKLKDKAYKEFKLFVAML